MKKVPNVLVQKITNQLQPVFAFDAMVSVLSSIRKRTNATAENSHYLILKITENVSVKTIQKSSLSPAQIAQAA